MNADLSTARYRLAELGALIAEPARTAILLALMDGSARPATELARIAGVAPGTASAHLQRLAEGGLLAPLAQGRHRYYRLADESVAQLVETLIVARAPTPQRLPTQTDATFAFARTCYRHLAGVLGVALLERLRRIDGLVVAEDGVRLAPRGVECLAEGGLFEADDARLRLVGRRCADWTERRFHLSGALGVAFTARFIDAGWLRRATRSRALALTPSGRTGFRRMGIETDAIVNDAAAESSARRR